MTTKKSAQTTVQTAREFELDGVRYERKESGYCLRDNVRIRAEVFEAAERDFDARAEEAVRKAAKEIPGVRKDLNPSAVINGHEYVHDWAGRAYYRDGERITRAEFEAETGGAEEAKALTARKRRPKDVAGEYETSAGTYTLTAKQLDFLHELEAAGEALLGTPEAGLWCDVLCDVIGGQFAGKPMTVGAMLSTLCEKGLGVRCKESRETAKGRTKKVTTFRLTPAGAEVYRVATGAAEA